MAKLRFFLGGSRFFAPLAEVSKEKTWKHFIT